MDKRQIINYINFAALICYIIGRVLPMTILCWIGLGMCTKHEYPRMDWLGYHDVIKYLDNHSLEGKRQDVELHFCGLPGTRRTIHFRTLNNEEIPERNRNRRNNPCSHRHHLCSGLGSEFWRMALRYRTLSDAISLSL